MERSYLSDQDLMQKIQAGDDSSFEFLVERYKVRLFNLIYRIIPNREEAEDILQETFLRVYRERKNYDAQFCFSTWVYTIALNLTRNELKRRKRWKFLGLDVSENHTNPETEKFEERTQMQIYLEKAIAELPLRYKTVFLLKELNQISYEEIAQILSLPVGTVKSRVNRARLILQNKLMPKLEGYYALWKSSQALI